MEQPSTRSQKRAGTHSLGKSCHYSRNPKNMRIALSRIRIGWSVGLAEGLQAGPAELQKCTNLSSLEEDNLTF
jgi:hypothetical protein